MTMDDKQRWQSKTMTMMMVMATTKTIVMHIDENDKRMPTVKEAALVTNRNRHRIAKMMTVKTTAAMAMTLTTVTTSVVTTMAWN